MIPDSSLQFRRCQTLYGRGKDVPVGRQNGRTVFLFSPAWLEAEHEPPVSAPWLEDPRLYINLTDVERRTWGQILSGLSIKSIAESEGVSRAAIYQRIEGNRLGQGGMVGKNVWVLLWWRLRQEKEASR